VEQRYHHVRPDFIDHAEHSRAREDQRLASQKEAGGLSPFRHTGGGGYVARSYVFFEGRGNQVV
jgi:hypothetical protein